MRGALESSQSAVGGAVAVLSPNLVLRKLDSPCFQGAIRRPGIGLFVLSALRNIASLAVRTWRWQEMLSPIKRMEHARAYEALAVGLMAN